MRFEIGSTVTGWEVIDKDGRAVSPSYDNPTVAGEVKDILNRAAASGHKTLARELGCIYDDDILEPA